MREVVDAIEKSGRFSGAGALYDSQLWELFQVKTPDAEQFVDDFEHFLGKHSLVRVDPFMEPFGDICFAIGRKNFIERCLMLSLQTLSLVDKCEFLWRLFLQAKLNSSNETLPFIESILDQCLDLFFYRYLNESNYLSFYRSAVDTMLATQIQSDRSTSLQYVGKIGGWAIIPERQVHSLSPVDLAKVSMVIDYVSASA